jgi:uncharacterized protein
MPDKTIEVVVKVTERCNIDCTYCYVFNRGDGSYKEHPPYMTSEVVEQLGSFLRVGAVETGATRVQLDFHGGEPLLMKRDRFAAMCESLQSSLAGVAETTFSIQTNAMLVDREWIELFRRFQIHVGVSLDGHREYNDRYRLDHKGSGTYEETVKGLTLLREARDKGLLPGVGILATVDPANDGRVVYRHFVDDLDISGFDFLLPIESHETFNKPLLNFEWVFCGADRVKGGPRGMRPGAAHP